jgi:TonB family protein
MIRIFGAALLLATTLQQPSAISEGDKPGCAMPAAARVWTVVDPAVVQTRVEPVWPATLRNASVQGTVLLDAWIDAEGRVACVKVTRSIPILDTAVVSAVQQWRFKPAKVGPIPIAVVQQVAVFYPPD